jgi:hypothetical protein
MLTEESYWKGPDAVDRRVTYKKDYTPEIEANGVETNRRINLVVDAYVAAAEKDAPTAYASGWRPPSVNEATANAAGHSKHLIAEAGDVKDDMIGSFAWWCYAHRDDVLSQPEIDMYMEHPAATVLGHPTPWCHLQTVPPGSGARAYFPDSTSSVKWAKYDQKSVERFA